MTGSFLITLAGAALLSSAAVAGTGAMAQPVKPLMPIAGAEGEWTTFGAPARTSARVVILRYDAKVHSKLIRPMIELRCGWAQTLNVEVLGLVPAQAFPQPALTLTSGEASIGNIADAAFIAASPAYTEATPPGMKFEGDLAKLNETKTISWPGYPAHAKVSTRSERATGFLQALQSGEPIVVRFNGQERRFPPVPAKMARDYAEACRTLTPFVPRRLDRAK